MVGEHPRRNRPAVSCRGSFDHLRSLKWRQDVEFAGRWNHASNLTESERANVIHACVAETNRVPTARNQRHNVDESVVVMEQHMIVEST